MYDLVLNFPVQLEEALKIGKQYTFSTEIRPFQNIVLTGLGGSGIGGSIVQNFVADKINIPFVVNKEYGLPAFVGPDTLVIVSSYSGNTEETLAAAELALKKKATVVCITSGGKLAQLAARKKLDCIVIPEGMPPRSCLGYSLVQQLFVLNHFGFIKSTFIKEVNFAAGALKDNQKAIIRKSKDLAKKIFGKLPVIYSAGNYEGVAIRFRQQINENSKMLCWHAVIPEMNHNELVGWRDAAEDKVVILLRDEADYERVQMRMEINKKVFKQYTKNIIEIYTQGAHYWEKVFYWIHLTDFVSVELAGLRGQDAVEVQVIDYLKGSLEKHK